MTAVASARPDAALGPAHLALFRELGDLKRVHSADRVGSIATRLFASGWQALVAGATPDAAMAATVAAALAAARLGDLDAAKLTELGLAAPEAVAVLQRGFDQVAGALDASLAARLRVALAADRTRAPGDTPAFVGALSRQPRAGVTCPGRPRLMLQPAENHAEHSVMVALYGVVAAPVFGADPAEVFLCGMGHHLYSASMPDSGFTGEVLLGDRLDAVIARSRASAMAQLAPALADRMQTALAHVASDRTPEARAFHAADVIDRVIEIEQHLVAARTTMDEVLQVYGLVHDGPVKRFHDQVLAQVGLLSRASPSRPPRP